MNLVSVKKAFVVALEADRFRHEAREVLTGNCGVHQHAQVGRREVHSRRHEGCEHFPGVLRYTDQDVLLELNDVLWGVSHELGANPTKFNAALIRFYLHEATDSRTMARRLKRLSTSELAAKSSRTKLTLRSDSDLLDRLKRVEEREGVTRSELVRGAVIAGKEDVFDRPLKGRMAQLRAIAEAV